MSALTLGQRVDPGEYRRLVDDGIVESDLRVELIEGRVLAMSPKSRAHEKAIAFLARQLFSGTEPERFEVRVASPLTIGSSEPEPDLAVVEHGTPEPNHPASAALVIEVAVSSQERDLMTKPRVYAGAEVPLYWVLDLDSGEVSVHSDPGGGRYRTVRVLGADGRLDGSALGLADIAVADVLAAAHR